VNLNVRCEYKRPSWWGTPEQRRAQKERIKNKIKQTKMLERNGNYSGMWFIKGAHRFWTIKLTSLDL
jgi:hypothetical protein